ncbi:MAG TPA: hypothetical protein VM869_05355 [Enhygromyxa sp.]|nr:hypothetical protein [Enhygromyxa sp.]
MSIPSYDLGNRWPAPRSLRPRRFAERARHLRALAAEARRRAGSTARFEREALERRLLELRRRLQAIREHVDLGIEDLECERDEVEVAKPTQIP